MKTLILFGGLPGSGKTTLSHKLRQILEAMFIDLDDFKKTDVDPTLVTSQIDPPEVRWQYYLKALDEAQSLFANGIETVVMDEVFHLAELRERIEGFCQKHGIACLWVEVRCPYDVVAQRLLSKPREGHILSSSEALAMYRLFGEIFEPFTADHCNHLIVENEDIEAIESAITHILKAVS